MFLVRIEAVRRLVHDEDGRIVQDRLRQADAPLEALGECVDGLVEHSVEFGLGNGRLDARLHVGAFIAAHFGDEAEELARGHVAIGGCAFREITDHALRLERLVFHVVSADGHATGAGREEARDHLHRGGFAGAVRAQKAQHFAFLDFEIDSGHGGNRAEAFCQFLDFDHGSEERA